MIAYRASGGFGQETSDLVEMVMEAYGFHYDLETGVLYEQSGEAETDNYVMKMPKGAFNHWVEKVKAFKGFDPMLVTWVKRLWAKMDAAQKGEEFVDIRDDSPAKSKEPDMEESQEMPLTKGE